LSFYHTRGATGTGNTSSYTNPKLDVLIDQQESEFDEEKRIRIIHDAQRMILKEHGPQLTLPSGNFYGVRWKYVHNPFRYFLDLGEGELSPAEAGPPGADTWTEEA
jgi:ABC-type transport system substrate-binding protein